MLRHVLAISFALASAGIAGDASARLFDASGAFPTEETAMAVHLPTGCMARVTLSEGRLFSAQIVDALCLPQGVPSRSVPASMTDFVIVSER